MYKEQIEKARILLEALPYIRKFHQKTIVIKYGGSLMENEDLKNLFAEDIVLLKYIGIHPIIVHGGGKEITKWSQKIGKKPVFIDGLRVTDLESMELIEMVLSGKINNEIISSINQKGGNAIGLSGKSANLFTGSKIRGKHNEDLGQVGNIDDLNVSLLTLLCEKEYIPVISSVGISETGESLNMNADHVAAEIAKALKALKLIYLTDVEGIQKENHLISSLDQKEAKTLLTHPDITGGMIPKLECSINAIENQVSQVHIINGNIEHAVLLEIFTDIGIGTMISKDKKGGR